MKKKMLFWLWCWLPPFLLMATIFYLSAQHSITVSSNDSEDFFVHKLVHVLEYALLTFLFFRSFYLYCPKSLSFKEKLMYAALCTALYGFIDEIHQTFVPTRTGRLLDVFIDGIGILIMVMYTRYQIENIKKILF